jgi:hypothetical protein
MNLSLHELDILLFVLENETVRRVFIKEARSWDHSLADARAMHLNVHNEVSMCMSKSLKAVND